jgi:hypothetical protein
MIDLAGKAGRFFVAGFLDLSAVVTRFPASARFLLLFLLGDLPSTCMFSSACGYIAGQELAQQST